MKKILFTYLFLFLTTTVAPIFAYNIDASGIVQPMQPYRLVNDFANVLNDAQEQQLENKLLDYNDKTSTQIYVVAIDSLNGFAIEDYALRVGRNWKIGQKDKNNGILILLSISDRNVDIEVGYGLESSISDYDSRHIINELIIPAFKDENYYEGLDNATTRIIQLADGTYTNDTKDNYQDSPISILWIIAFIVILIYLMYRFPLVSRIVFFVLSSGGGSSGSRSSGGFGGGGGGSFGGGGSSGRW